MMNACNSDYYYNMLILEENGENKQKCYKEFLSVISNYYDEPVDMIYSFKYGRKQYWYRDSIDYSKYGLTWDEAAEVCYAVYKDCPMVFFVDTYKMGGNPDKKIIAPLVDYEFIYGAYRKSIVSFVEYRLLNEIKMIKGNTPTEIAKSAFDHLVLKGKYDYLKGQTDFVDIPSHSVIGYLRSCSAVCEGYARIFQAMVNYFDVRCVSVSGYMKSNSGQKEKHAFNMFYSDSGWHIVDVAVGITDKEHKKGFCEAYMKDIYIASKRDKSSSEERIRHLPLQPQISDVRD